MVRVKVLSIVGYIIVLASFLIPVLYVPVYVPLERYMGTTIIAAFGDSIFEGLYLPQKDGFPALLKNMLRANGFNVDVVNDGFSGETTSYALQRVSDIIGQRPDIVILEFSTNDIAYGIPAQQTRVNIEQILTRLREAGIRTLVVGQKAFPSRGPEYAASFDPIFCDLAERFNAFCYPDLFKAIRNRPELIQGFYHPTAEGMKAIVEDMYPVVAQMVKRTRKR